MHLTDPHLFADTAGQLRGTVTYSSLSAVLEHYQQSDWRAELALVTGDLIQDDSAGAYQHFLQLLGTLELPVYCVPGNHDIRALMRKAVATPPFYYCDSVEKADWLIIGIDSCISDDAGGFVTAEEFERLETLIDCTTAAHVMVCLHHPPVNVGSKWLDTVGLRNGDEYLQRVAVSGKVRLTIFGHVHQPYDAIHAGIRILGTPSTCRQFAQGSEDFAIDDNPPAYRRISLRSDGRQECELIWVGDA